MRITNSIPTPYPIILPSGTTYEILPIQRGGEDEDKAERAAWKLNADYKAQKITSRQRLLAAIKLNVHVPVPAFEEMRDLSSGQLTRIYKYVMDICAREASGEMSEPENQPAEQKKSGSESPNSSLASDEPDYSDL